MTFQTTLRTMSTESGGPDEQGMPHSLSVNGRGYCGCGLLQEDGEGADLHHQRELEVGSGALQHPGPSPAGQSLASESVGSKVRWGSLCSSSAES